MFTLEQSISEWRQQMLAAGIKSPVPLEELEIHLRDEIEQRVKAGQSAQQAFEMAVQEIGQTNTLKTEFAKVGVSIYERLRRLGCALAGIPEYQLAMNMNIPNQNLEPRWATYLKNAAVILPALFFWVGSACFIVPKLKEVCSKTSVSLPRPIIMAFDVSEFVKNNILILFIAILTALICFEWRWRKWPRYRRMVFGVIAYILNFTVLLSITTFLVLAIIASNRLIDHLIYPSIGSH